MFSVAVTDCKAISPVHPIFCWSWSPKNNLSQHCSTKPIPTTTSSTAYWLRTRSTEWVIACMQKAQTNCIRVPKHIKLYNNPTTLEFNQATPNAYQTIALCLSFELGYYELCWHLDDQPLKIQQQELKKCGVWQIIPVKIKKTFCMFYSNKRQIKMTFNSHDKWTNKHLPINSNYCKVSSQCCLISYFHARKFGCSFFYAILETNFRYSVAAFKRYKFLCKHIYWI